MLFVVLLVVKIFTLLLLSLINVLSWCLFLAVRTPSKSITTFKIPEIHFPLMFQCVHSYYTDFFNHLSKAISTLPPENSAMLARYFYLRGLVSLMQGKLLNALSDFQNLEKTDLRIFPTDLVRKIVETLPRSERLQADRKPELKRLISRVMEKQREVLKVDDHVKNFELPKTHMQLDDFVKRIQESGIVRDIDTIHRLFDALTVGEYKTFVFLFDYYLALSHEKGRFTQTLSVDWSVSALGKLSPLCQCSIVGTLHCAAAGWREVPLTCPGSPAKQRDPSWVSFTHCQHPCRTHINSLKKNTLY